MTVLEGCLFFFFTAVLRDHCESGVCLLATSIFLILASDSTAQVTFTSGLFNCFVFMTTKDERAFFANTVYFIIILFFIIIILKVHVQTTHRSIFPGKDLISLSYHLPPPYCFKYLTMKRETDEIN